MFFPQSGLKSALRSSRSLRHHVLVWLVGAQVALTLGLGGAAWWVLETSLRHQAQDSATAVGHVLAGGGFTPTPEILVRMRALTGHDFQLVAVDQPAPADHMTVVAGSQQVAVSIHTPAYVKQRRALGWGIVVAVLTGSAVAVALAWLISRRVVKPIEQLASAARAMGDGDWSQPVHGVGPGEIAHLAATLEDTRKRLITLTAARERDQRLAALGTFAAIIAHEVRNPLTAIRLAGALVAQDRPGDRALQLIQDESERLELVVDQVLGVARGHPVQPEPVDVMVVIQDTVRLLQRQADHAGVSMHLSGQGRVASDPRRLRQCLLNLIMNGIQAVQRSGGSTVWIRAQQDGFVVEDDGEGVSAELLPMLFDAFATGRPEGTGLGLHLAKSVVVALGGELVYAPRAPRGAVFTVRGLPPDTSLGADEA